VALRGQLPDSAAVYADPVRGVNFRDSFEDLRPGEARLMQNCIYDGGTRKRLGSTRLTTASLGAFKIRGGEKFYHAAGTSTRLIAYSTKVSKVSDAGAETILTSGMTTDLDTHFTTWSITDEAYVANGTDVLRKITTGEVLSTVVGTNIPSPKLVLPILDRLLAITNDGIERTDARSATIWSLNSSWATFRPSLVGRFTALHPYSFESSAGGSGIIAGALAFQPNAYYILTGTDFGTSVIAASPSVGEDASITLRDSGVGTSSPYAITSVPGVGVFWFTTDANVYWLPNQSPTGRYVGDRIISTDPAITGINNVNKAALGQVVMRYFNRFLVLGIPTGSNVYPSTYFFMDMRAFVERPERGPVWYGPMSGPTVGRLWVENQGTDNFMYSGEGNSATGAFVYKQFSDGIYTDAIGTADTSITMIYQTYLKGFGREEREKYVRAVQMELNLYSGTATLDVIDASSNIATGLAITQLT